MKQSELVDRVLTIMNRVQYAEAGCLIYGSRDAARQIVDDLMFELGVVEDIPATRYSDAKEDNND